MPEITLTDEEAITLATLHGLELVWAKANSYLETPYCWTTKDSAKWQEWEIPYVRDTVGANNNTFKTRGQAAQAYCEFYNLMCPVEGV